MNTNNKYLNNREKVWISPKWNSDELRDLIRRLLDNDLEPLKDKKIIHNSRNRVIVFSHNNFDTIKKDLLVKEFPLKRLYDKIRFCFINSKAERSLNIANILINQNILTPEPIAIIEIMGSMKNITKSWYITEFINYDCCFQALINNGEHKYSDYFDEFLRLIAKDIRKMHDNGLIHNDMHAGNILIKLNNRGTPDIYYIDLNRGRSKKNISFRLRVRDLIRFDLEREKRLIFLKEYDKENYNLLLKAIIKRRNLRNRFIKFKNWIRRRT